MSLRDDPSEGYEDQLPSSFGSYQAHLIVPGLIRARSTILNPAISAELTLVWGLEVIMILEGPPG